MSRLINFLLFLFVLIGAFWLYQVKHEAKVEGEKIATLEKQIQDEKDALLLLKAEWSYLNRPERVQMLNDEFTDKLGLKSIEPYQIGDLSDVPDRDDELMPGAVVHDLEALMDQTHPQSVKTQ
ncbi:hypothetical protein [uncultured Cohaesibacter sp.]|uniref:cell division protein FtsL n=1 Tax=uncultured Cohaesibacter sp. TaxID=1002546 RepID=UPI00292DF3F5|nr:hypothetical protein [uncultured Cohaesibacter sp.]